VIQDENFLFYHNLSTSTITVIPGSMGSVTLDVEIGLIN